MVPSVAGGSADDSDVVGSNIAAPDEVVHRPHTGVETGAVGQGRHEGFQLSRYRGPPRRRDPRDMDTDGRIWRRRRRRRLRSLAGTVGRRSDVDIDVIGRGGAGDNPIPHRRSGSGRRRQTASGAGGRVAGHAAGAGKGILSGFLGREVLDGLSVNGRSRGGFRAAIGAREDV